MDLCTEQMTHEEVAFVTLWLRATKRKMTLDPKAVGRSGCNSRMVALSTSAGYQRIAAVINCVFNKEVEFSDLVPTKG